MNLRFGSGYSQLISVAVVRAKVGVWCDYCNYRWHKNSINHNKAASWTVISESPEFKGRMRSYCQSCAESVSWQIDGKDFGLEEQFKYAQSQRELNYGTD